MKGTISEKSHSWWWKSHINPKNSNWMAENLEEMEMHVKSMLKLIEEEGDSFAKRAEMYYKNRPELITHVEGFYRMYRALAERYDHVTGELHKNIPSELHSQDFDSGSAISLKSPSPSLLSAKLNPESNRTLPKPSLTSDSLSDPEDGKEVSGHDLTESINQRIVELEKELHDVKEKLREYEEKGSYGKCEHMENGEYISRISALEDELAVASKRLHISEALIVTMKQKKLAEGNASLEAEHVELNQEKEQVLEMEERIAVLEAEITDHKNVTEKLNGVIAATNKKFEDELANRDHVIEGYKAELADASKRFLQEMFHLEADVTKLNGTIGNLRAELNKISQEKSVLASVADQENVINKPDK